MIGRHVRAAILLVLVAVAGGAQAQSAQTREQAAALQADGFRLLDQHDAAGALEKFQAAYALVASPKVLFNMGLAHKELGHSALAYECFEQFLIEANAVPPKRRAEAELVRSELRSQLAFVEVEGPPAAEVSIDNNRRAVLPLARPIAIEPGARVLRVNLGREILQNKTVSLEAGSTLQLVVQAAPAPLPPTLAVAPAPRSTAAPQMLAPTPRPGRDEERPSVFRRWWFWTAVGAVVVTAVGVAVLRATPKPECPTGVHCY